MASCSQQVTRTEANNGKHGLRTVSGHTGKESVSDGSTGWTAPKAADGSNERKGGWITELNDKENIDDLKKSSFPQLRQVRAWFQ